MGHTLVPPRPALVPLTTSAAWVQSLQGVTVPDVQLRVVEPVAGSSFKTGDESASGATASSSSSAVSNLALLGKPAVAPKQGFETASNQPPPGEKPSQDASADKPRVLDTRRGSLLFAHFGLSGPVALDISRVVSGHPRPQSLRLEFDFLPDVKAAVLDEQLMTAAATAGKRQIVSLAPNAVPHRLLESLVRQAGLDGQQKGAELSKAGRAALVRAIKQTSIALVGTRGFGKAEVTAGGIPLAEVDSRTMESRVVPGLFLAGEVLDLDGPIGGYNFQAAFSTGWLAGLTA
ncbi:MAG: aminoacetone oxidase family FAD-binding enzyme [Pirellulales bacterium]|nr:aminoacetone oxidase family FAD-binding enzyme [Pirellulales bacterium]